MTRWDDYVVNALRLSEKEGTINEQRLIRYLEDIEIAMRFENGMAGRQKRMYINNQSIPDFALGTDRTIINTELK
jgi:hypothetical protein